MASRGDESGDGEGLVSSPMVLAALSKADYGFVQLRRNGEIRAVNEEFLAITGHSRDECVGISFTDFLTTVPSSLESLLSDDDAVYSSLRVVLSLNTQDGSVVSCKTQLVPVDGADAIVGIISSQPVRESGSAQLDPEQDEGTAGKAFLALADSLSDGIIVLNTASQIQYANPAVSEILGYSPEELVGESQLSIIPERLRQDHLEGLNQYLETGERHIDWRYVELPGQHKDGHEVPLGISLNDFFFEGERYFVGLFRDISKRKEVEQKLRDREEELEELVEKLEESNERLEQFAYAASHDLQEPLRMVSSYLQLIERRYADELDEDAEEFIEFAVDGAERMRTMIDGLLEYSRVETEGAPLEPIELESVVSDVRTDLQLKIQESDAEITVASLPRVRGDPDQLRQVFQNLLDNAIEYSGDERPRIEIDARRRGQQWLISVSDDGIGIDPANADRIFQVFQRLHNHAEHPGIGIGLSLCQRIVERHGGEIWMDSEPGEGTTFSFTLPAVEAADQ